MTPYRMFIHLGITLIMSTAQQASAVATVNTCKALVIVNKETITQSDLDQRIKLLTLTGGLSSDAKIGDNLKAEILKSLIQEKLQLHAAKLKQINVSDADVDRALTSMAKENNMDLNKLVEMLGKGGVQKETLASRIRAQMAWSKYLRQMYTPLVHVGESEIDHVLSDLKNRKDKTQYLISEITLLVSQPDQSKRALNDAEKIISDLKAGANFSVLAQQLSKDVSSQRGGDLGWVSLEQVDPAVAPTLQKLKPGSISSPIRTAAGYKIIKVRDVRQAGEADPGETELSLCQVLFPITPQSTEEEINQIGQQVQSTLDARGCAAFKERAKESGFKIQETQLGEHREP